MIFDNFGRKVNYLRLAVTDKCNLRCFYCMPKEGLNWLTREELLSFSEMEHICRLLVKNGIEKIRITGGEPFVRKGVMEFLATLAGINGLEELTITTNGVLTAPLVPELKKLGIKTVNLSMDTLDRDRFIAITHRDELNAVLDTLTELLKHDIEVKVNAVVMENKNIEDIIPLVQLTKDNKLSMRFIEEMPFNGEGNRHPTLVWDEQRIMAAIRDAYPEVYKIKDPKYSTSSNYQIPGHMGTVGVIAAYTRSFCGTCNRIRITAEGMLKTCLYDGGVLNIRNLMRSGSGDDVLFTAISDAIHHRERDGWDAERKRPYIKESMATIGG